MSSEVPYLKKEVIEAEAELVLAEYGQQHGPFTAPPIPVDEIVELHLKLTLEIRDLQKIFGFGDVQGAIPEAGRDKHVAVRDSGVRIRCLM